MNTKLNVKQWAFATVVVFLISLFFAYIQNRVILPTPPAMEGQVASGSDAMTGKILVYLARLVMAGLFAYIYTKVSEGKTGIAHGARYGLGIGLLMVLPSFLIGLEYSGMSASTHITNKLVELISSVLCGIATALLYKPSKA